MTSEDWADAMSIIADGLSAVTEGCRLPVRMSNSEEPLTDQWPMAEILSIRQNNGINQYYVHFVDYNKRLDEWVDESRLDTRKVEPPSSFKDDKTGLNTPIKRQVSLATSTVSSRPTSPGPTATGTPTSDSILTGTTVLAAALQKKNARKRRGGPIGNIQLISN